MKALPFIIFLTIILSATELTAAKHWIFLRDKGLSEKESTEEISNLRRNWHQKSLERRQTNGQTITIHDLPISETYVTQLQKVGCNIICRSRWLNAISANLKEEDIEEINSLTFVSEVIPIARGQKVNFDLHETDIYGSDNYQLRGLAHLPFPYGDYGESFAQALQAGVIEAHRRGFTGTGVMLGMLDTGFQLDHRAFAAMELVAQYDFIFNDPDPSYDPSTDPRGQPYHGSACLSVITGYEPGHLVGIAPQVSVAVGKTEFTGSETRVEEDYWVAGIEWLEWLGADVVSSSLSYRSWYRENDYDGVTSPATRAAQRAFELGVVICNSAGNSGPGAVTIGVPSDAPGVLAIAAVDSTGKITGFSSRGPSSDGRVKPDIAARGYKVTCIQPMTYDQYSRWNGTSLSCPIVAGVACLVREAHPEWTSAEVIKALTMTASRIEHPDYTYGYGIVNAAAAIDYPAIQGKIIISGSESFDMDKFFVTLTGEENLRDLTGLSSTLLSFPNLPQDRYRLRLYYDGGLIQDVSNLSVPIGYKLNLVVDKVFD